MRTAGPAVLLATATVAVIAAWGPTSRAAATVLAERRASYLEDEQTGRRLAALRVTVVAAARRAVVRIYVSAKGDEVEPVPSYRGVSGANHITARELTALHETGQLRVVVMPRDGTTKQLGRVVPIARGPVPERRLRPGGQLDLDAHSAERYLLELRAETPALAPGEHEIYLEAKGVPRLRVNVRIERRSAQILDVVSLGGHDLTMEAPR